MSVLAPPAEGTTSVRAQRVLVSADSHVIEPPEVWKGLLPDDFWDVREMFSVRPGGVDPAARIDEMDVDGVSAEVLYASLAMKLFTEPAGVQTACFARYNDWIAEFCEVAPNRLVGIGLVASHDMKAAVAEVQRCVSLGLRGVQVWQCPPPDLAFNSGHYEPLWEACADLALPVSLHVVTGFGYPEELYAHGNDFPKTGDFAFLVAINKKLRAVMDAVTEIVLSGAPDRHRGLKLVLVENEVGWLPYFVDQLDYYYNRFRDVTPIKLDRKPSEIVNDQLFATFFRDPNAAFAASRVTNLMWSSDYPHGNSTWPESQSVVDSRLGELSELEIERLVKGTVTSLYGIELEA